MKPDQIRMNEIMLDKLLEAVEEDRVHQGEDRRILREELRRRSASFIPDKMAEDFYRGMLSSLFSLHVMLPDTMCVEHAVVTVEELMRVVLFQIEEERARRSMEVA